MVSIALCGLQSPLWASSFEPKTEQSEQTGHTSQPELEQSNPFDWLDGIPMTVDVAAVFNNPAKEFLLNDSGRSIRKILTLGGVFSQTEHAWDALAAAFNVDTDETIKNLLGKRVVVVWDGIGSSSHSIIGFANAMDTHWTLICEVDPAYIHEIRAQLKPIRRRIEHGHPVYAIEKGRYEIVLLNKDPQRNDAALVLLSPKKGSSLLNHVLESIVTNTDAHLPSQTPNQDQNPDREPGSEQHHSILHQRAELISNVEFNEDWSLAWIVQLDRVFPNPPSDDPRSPHSPALVGIMNATDQGISISYATDMPIKVPQHDAPVGLLSAVGPDAIMAIAVSQTPEFFTENKVFGFNFTSGNNGIDESSKTNNDHRISPEHNQYPDGPGLILLSEISVDQSERMLESTQPPVALTVMTQLEPHPTTDEPLANRMDQIMLSLFESYEQARAPDYQGRFPSAVRTHTLMSPSAPLDEKNPEPQSESWPGPSTKFSWLASDLPSSSSMIVCLGPAQTNTAKQARWMAHAAQNLDSISDQNKQAAVLISGYLRPARAVSLLDSVSSVDLAISKLIDRIEWEVSRSPVGLRGYATIEFADLAKRSNLGSNKPK